MLKQYLLVIKPMTDVSEVKMEDEPRKCACGCGMPFMVAVGSTQKFRSEDCKKLMGWSKEAANHAWKRGMEYMVRG
jgi:hypothetical protein